MRLPTLFTVIALLSANHVAHADLFGDTVHATFNFPMQSTVYQDDGNITVPGGTLELGIFNVSISANEITILDTGQAGFTPGQFNDFVFTDLTRDPIITGVSEVAGSSVFAGAIPTFTSNSVALNFEDLDLHPGPGQFATFDLTFAPSASSVTPEPSSFALLGTGLLAAAGVVKRRFA